MKAPIFYTYYELDAKGFIEKLCENKERPELACNGKCFLNKVSENENQEDSNNVPKINWEELMFYVVNEVSEKQMIATEHIIHRYFYMDFLQSGEEFEIFHPPKKLFT